MVDPQDIKRWIEQNLENSRVEIEGDGTHFSAVVVCEAFAGKTMIAQHRMVYDALGDRMKGEIHALSMRTLTPEQWAREQAA